VSADLTGPFVAIGENVHASRTCARRGPGVIAVEGEEVLRFRDVAGVGRQARIALPVAQSAAAAEYYRLLREGRR